MSRVQKLFLSSGVINGAASMGWVYATVLCSKEAWWQLVWTHSLAAVASWIAFGMTFSPH